jgi:hypothetical protein
MPYTTRDLLTTTFQKLTILAAGETLSPEDAAFGLENLTLLFDDWNAERAGVYANRQDTYTLVPSLNPHTIGPSAATFTVTQRPVSIEYANIVLSDGVRVGLDLIGSREWASIPLPAIETGIPRVLHYEPTWPNGSLYLYPVPSAAYSLNLMTRIVLADLALGDTVTLPPGYRNAIILTLGEMIAPTYPPAEPDPVAASKARGRIFANNDETPSLATRDAGMPGAGRRGRYFDWRSGLMRP